MRISAQVNAYKIPGIYEYRYEQEENACRYTRIILISEFLTANSTLNTRIRVVSTKGLNGNVHNAHGRARASNLQGGGAARRAVGTFIVHLYVRTIRPVLMSLSKVNELFVIIDWIYDNISILQGAGSL